MTKTKRLLSVLLAVMMVLSLMPTGAMAAKKAETPPPLTWWGYDENDDWVEQTAVVGTTVGTWGYLPLEVPGRGTIGWVWYQNADRTTSTDKPSRIDLLFSVYDGYGDIQTPGADADEGYYSVTIPAAVANIEDETCVGDSYYGGKNFAIMLKEDYSFTRYGTYYANAYNSYEAYQSSGGTDGFAGATLDNDGYQLTWWDANGNKANYIRAYANIQTRDPDHVASVLNNDTVQLTVTGFQNLRGVSISSVLKGAEIDPSRDMTAFVLDGTDEDFDAGVVELSGSGQSVSADFGSYQMKNGVTYAVRIPIMPTDASLAQALNAAGPFMSRKALEDAQTKLSFHYDLMTNSGTSKTVEYYERPLFDVPNMNGANLSVTHVWDDGAANHANDVVTIGLYQSGSSTALATAELNQANGFSGSFSGLGTGNSFRVQVEQITSNGKDVTAQYETETAVGESTGTWNRVTPASVLANKAENRIYAVSYVASDNKTYLLANTGNELTPVDFSAIPVTVSNGKFTVSNLGTTIGGEGFDSWNHMQWVVMSGATDAKILPYNLGSSRAFSTDSYYGYYKISMNAELLGADVQISTSGNDTVFATSVSGSQTQYYFKKALIEGARVDTVTGKNYFQDSVSGAAKFTFYEYAPSAIEFTLTSTEREEIDPAKYTVTWNNYDGTQLDAGTWLEGEMPEYEGQTPIRPADADGTTYTFKGWTPAVTAVTGDATYTATFEAHAPAANTVKLNVTNYTKGGAAVTVNGVSKTDKDASFDVNANASVTVSVSADKACAVGLQNADGTYTRLKATKSGNVYNYIVSIGSANAALVVGYKGDFNANGSLQAVDVTLTAKTVGKLYSASELQKFLGDTNGNGSLQAVDVTLTAKTVAKLYTPAWDIKK